MSSLNRTLDRWRKSDPYLMATLLSPVAIENAFRAAQQDIATLADALDDFLAWAEINADAVADSDILAATVERAKALTKEAA